MYDDEVDDDESDGYNDKVRGIKNDQIEAEADDGAYAGARTCRINRSSIRVLYWKKSR